MLSKIELFAETVAQICVARFRSFFVFLRLRSLFLVTVSCVLLGPALLLLTVSSESLSFASLIAHFADSLVRFASLGAAFADSLVRIVIFCFWDRSF